MAINSIQLCEDHTVNSVYSEASKKSAITECHLVKINYANGSITSSTNNNKKLKSKLSPYLPSNRLQLLSRLTEKKLYKKTEFLSSFPLAANIYKANSDEFKLKKKRGKKNKKSVLTLPNAPSALPQSCTVSDMNDSEYFNSEKNNKPKKRLALSKKKVRPGSNFEFYDRDAKYCSQVNIDLDCSSTDMIKAYKGNPKNKCCDAKMRNDEEVQPHDVWAVLRNINRFQFHPSPPISEDSIVAVSPRKRKPIKKNKRKTARVIETCRTEQFYFDVGCKSGSRSSSIDRITVIEGSVKNHNENKQSSLAHITLPMKPKSPGNKKNKPRRKKLHNQSKFSCSPEVRKNEELNTNNDADVGCCRMINNIWDDSVSPSVKSQASNYLTDRTDDSLRDPSSGIPTEVVLTQSPCSGSNFSISGRKGKQDKFSKTQLHESHKFNGATKVTLSKGQELALTKRQSLIQSQRKPRLVTTMPSIIPAPKLTQTDIRRRLANINYPIIILGKDQLSGTVKVEQHDYSQFDGLDKHIWPFMVQWSGDGKTCLNPEVKDKKRNNIQDPNLTSNKKPTNFLILNKQYLKIKKPSLMDFSPSGPKQKEHKILPTNHVNIIQSHLPVKAKPIHQFRDKMLNLLYKKASSQNIAKENILTDGGQGDVEMKPVPENKRSKSKKNDNGDKDVDPRLDMDKHKQGFRQVPTPPSDLLAPKQQWGKTKWASTFIENVMKKIRAGVYYSHDSCETDSKSHSGAKEVSIQAGVPSNSIGINVVEGCDDLTPKIIIQKRKEALAYLPGFDDDIPQIEIKSMTRNQLSVKHCVTNVMLQFDVCTPSEQEQGNNFKRSMSFIPLTVTDSKTKVYKCKARIFNAMLPAEICSIIPKLINKLENPDGKLALPSIQKSVDTCLSTITEFAGSEILNMSNSTTPLIPHIKMTPELSLLVYGKFPIQPQRPSKCRKYSFTFIDMPSLTELLSKPRINGQYYLQFTLTSPLLGFKNKCILSELPQIQATESSNSCTDLVPFNPIKATTMSWDCSKFAQSMLSPFFYPEQRGMTNFNFNFNGAHISLFGMNSPVNNISVNLKSYNVNEISNTVSINLKNFKVESLYSALSNIMLSKFSMDLSSKSVKCIEYIKNAKKPKADKIRIKTAAHTVVAHKQNKRVYMKLYKKCKSTSHISVEKSCSTALTKINNMEDFFQAMGTSKPLSDAYDGYSSRKIIASIIEMKSWITEISPRQALLVLLLSNKKDTPNLVKFRPVILQGIAVNRITRISELDMEIEVIERESFNKLSEHEGTPDAPSTMYYADNLLEELYWIAKTTASDYQRPFDESSEKLLKALLEKRKKLNPSYLRVMARYVGLGLLKPPAKN